MRAMVSLVLLGLLGLAAGCSSNGSGLGHLPDADQETAGDTTPSTEAGPSFLGEEGAVHGDGDRGIVMDGGEGAAVDDGGLDSDDLPPTFGSVVDGRIDDGVEAVPELADLGGDDAGFDTSADTLVGDVSDADDGPALPTDAEVDGAACNAPACFAELMKDCEPVGTCTQQASSYRTEQCYANGVQVVARVETAAATSSSVVKNANRTCYQLDYDLVALLKGATVVGQIKDGNGTTVAALGDDASGRTKVTCPGALPVVLNEACDPVIGANGAGCSTGTCGP